MASILSPSSPTLALQSVIGRHGRNWITTQQQLPVVVFQLSNGNGNGNTSGSISRGYRRTRSSLLMMRKVATSSIQGEVIENKDDDDESTSCSSDENLDYGVVAMHHVGILCENLERSLDFYQNILGLEINEARPDDKLPYRGAWLWVGSEMIHLMELPNPDPLTGRAEHGGRDRHTCISIRDVSKLRVVLDNAGIPYTLSKSGRPAIFTRDPDANALEFTQVDA